MQDLEKTWAILDVDLNANTTQEMRQSLELCLSRLENVLPRQRIMLLISCEDLTAASEFVSKVPSSNILLQTQSEGCSAAALLPLLLEVEKKDRHARILYLSCGALTDPRWLDSMIANIARGLSSSERSRVLLWEMAKSFTAPISVLLLLYMLTDASLVQSYLKQFDPESFVFWGQANSKQGSHDLFEDLLGNNPAFLHIRALPEISVIPMSLAQNLRRNAGRSSLIQAARAQEAANRRVLH